MKLVMLLAWFSLPAGALAVDYSACVAEPLVSGGPRDFTLSPAGRLVMNRSAPGVVRTESSEQRDVLVTKTSDGRGTRTQELRFRDGKPYSLTTTYPLGGDHRPERATRTEAFAYRDGRCYLSEMSIRYTHGPDAGRTLVNYHHELCDETSRYRGNGAARLQDCREEFRLAEERRQSRKDAAVRLPTCGDELRQARTLLKRYDGMFRVQSRERRLFAHNPEDAKENTFETLFNINATCVSMRALRPGFPYLSGGGRPLLRMDEGNAGSGF